MTGPAMTDTEISHMMQCCRLCPRECGVDRTAGQYGVCRSADKAAVARAALHFWEEPCISGTAGSGAVFFTGCSLGCVYCQNAEISGADRGKMSEKRPAGRAQDRPGRHVTVEQLARIFLRLQEQGADNINLVTATHFIPQAAAAVRLAKEHGLGLPVIYNTGGYEKVSSLRMLEGLVDVYLPDFKYMTPALARRYSGAEDYPERAAEALAEMVRQTGESTFCPERNCPERQMIRRGVIVRNLLLPGHVEESKKVVRYLHETYGNSIYISLMNQYTPMRAVSKDPLLHRKTTKREYERLVDYALEIGVEHGYIQEGGTAEESFIPSWDGEGTGDLSGL